MTEAHDSSLPVALVLNGSVNEIVLIEQAKLLGYRVVTTGNAPDLIGHKFADDYVPVDYSDCKAVLALANKLDISRIISCANDFGAITSCYVAEQLGIPGHDRFINALTLHRKDKFKKYIQKLGIRTPKSVALQGRNEAHEYVKNISYPIIVKATDLTGGKGVNKATSYEEACRAIDDAFRKTRTDTILIEPYISGNQQSAVAFVEAERVAELVSCDCYMPINPYLIQSETLPARGFSRIEAEIRDIIEGICQDLSLVDGIFILQYIVSDGKPYVIEMMRRAPGNQFLRAARAVTGFHWEEALVRAETGAGFDGMQRDTPLAAFTGHHGVMGTHNGVISGYHVAPELESHLFKHIDMMKPGDKITDYLNERVAYLYYAFDTREAIDEIAPRLNELASVDYV